MTDFEMERARAICTDYNKLQSCKRTIAKRKDYLLEKQEKLGITSNYIKAEIGALNVAEYLLIMEQKKLNAAYKASLGQRVS